MSRIRSKNTTPEKIVRAVLTKMGYNYRLHKKDLPGTPDIVLSKYKTVIFCNGCFWHQHPGCKRSTSPKTNKEYWFPKLQKNVDRFTKIKNELEQKGWRVVVIWECETKVIDDLQVRLKKIFEESMP